MGWKSFIIKPFARRVARRIAELSKNDAAVAAQNAVFQRLILRGAKTVFGRDHVFSEIKTYAGQGLDDPQSWTLLAQLVLKNEKDGEDFSSSRLVAMKHAVKVKGRVKAKNE